MKSTIKAQIPAKIILKSKMVKKINKIFKNI